MSSTSRSPRRLVPGWLLTATICLVLVSGLAGFAAAVRDAAPVKLLVADERSLHHLNLYVAQELGLFKKRGLEVVLIEARDPAQARDLVVTGQADLFWSCPSVALMAVAQGAPLKVIAQAKTPCGAVLVVPKGSRISKAADLKGARIAGLSANCEGVLAYQARAREAGGAFQVVVESASRAVVELNAGKLDGAILEEPHLSLALGKGGRPVLSETAAGFPCRTITARSGILQERPEALKRFVAASAEANAWLARHQKSAQAYAIAERYSAVPTTILPKALGRFKFSERIDEGRIDRLVGEMLKAGIIRESPQDRLYAQEFRGVTWGAR